MAGICPRAGLSLTEVARWKSAFPTGRKAVLKGSRSGALVELSGWTPRDTAVILHRDVTRATVPQQSDDLLEAAALRARVTRERIEPVAEGAAFMPARPAPELGDQRHDPPIASNHRLLPRFVARLDELAMPAWPSFQRCCMNTRSLARRKLWRFDWGSSVQMRSASADAPG